VSKNVPTFERQQDETDAAWQAFCAYRDIGPGRSQQQAWRIYAGERGLTAPMPTGSFRGWVKTYDWEGRAAEYDASIGAEVDATSDLLAPHAESLVEWSVLVAKGQADITKEQASVLNKLLGYIIEPKKVPASAATFNGPTQINMGAMTPQQLLELMRVAKK